MTKLIVLGIVAALAWRLAMIQFNLYRSTDFEVHRNWLAITHSLPVSRWYHEDTSEWTLDYPPFFALFEWVLSQVAVLADPLMVQVSGLGYASHATVVFQRCSVIAGDLVLVIGARRLGSVLASASQGWTSALLMLVGPGLLIVDHVHFQYNGMLLGLLLFSIADVEAGRIYRGAALFCVLLNMKQIFLYTAPVYFFYLLRGHCGCKLQGGFPCVSLNFGNLIRLGATVVAVFLVAWLPLLVTGQLGQAASRLFPFGRGLTHAYWAPNVWALYNTADRVLAKLGFGSQHGASSTAGFAEVYQSSVLWTVPPKATFVLVLFAYVPLARTIWRQTKPYEAPGAERRHESAAMPHAGRGLFALYVALGSAIAFSCGWHVHEKALLMVTVPLTAAVSAVRSSDSGLGASLVEVAVVLSVVGTFSLFPLLPQRWTETTFKWSVAAVGHALELVLLIRPDSRGSQGKGCLRMLSVWFVPGSAVLLGILLLGWYADFGGHHYLFKGRMEFLPLLFISDFTALLILPSFVRLFVLTGRLSPGGA